MDTQMQNFYSIDTGKPENVENRPARQIHEATPTIFYSSFSHTTRIRG
jgi:hypothetical protein